MVGRDQGGERKHPIQRVVKQIFSICVLQLSVPVECGVKRNSRRRSLLRGVPWPFFFNDAAETVFDVEGLFIMEPSCGALERQLACVCCGRAGSSGVALPCSLRQLGRYLLTAWAVPPPFARGHRTSTPPPFPACWLYLP